MARLTDPFAYNAQMIMNSVAEYTIEHDKKGYSSRITFGTKDIEKESTDAGIAKLNLTIHFNPLCSQTHTHPLWPSTANHPESEAFAQIAQMDFRYFPFIFA